MKRDLVNDIKISALETAFITRQSVEWCNEYLYFNNVDGFALDYNLFDDVAERVSADRLTSNGCIDMLQDFMLADSCMDRTAIAKALYRMDNFK